MPKNQIRNEILTRRRQLTADTCLAWSSRIQQALVGQPEFIAANSLGLYSSIRNEVFTEQVFAVACEWGKKVVYPKICDEKLEFIEVTDLRQLRPGAFGIPEPDGCRRIPVSSLELIVLPGVAFDLSGYRLGYGKGFYDRVLHDLKLCTLIGIAFEWQLIESLPVEIHDIRMDMVITEERVLRFDRRSPQVIQQYSHGGSGR
jgi:5-formyltetrahydrofolate cyclo-ligase